MLQGQSLVRVSAETFGFEVRVHREPFNNNNLQWGQSVYKTVDALAVGVTEAQREISLIGPICNTE